MLEVQHADDDLAQLERDPDFTAGYSVAVVKQFRILMQTIRTVSRRAVLYQFRGRRLKKLEGDRQHQHSMRLNRKWRLIVEFEESEVEDERIVIVAIENHYEQ